MLRLEQVNGRNVWDILKLTVKEDQKSFVADNAISIIEAYTAITANGCAFPFGIYENETPVGFLMILPGKRLRERGCSAGSGFHKILSLRQGGILLAVIRT